MTGIPDAAYEILNKYSNQLAMKKQAWKKLQCQDTEWQLQESILLSYAEIDRFKCPIQYRNSRAGQELVKQPVSDTIQSLLEETEEKGEDSEFDPSKMPPSMPEEQVCDYINRCIQLSLEGKLPSKTVRAINSFCHYLRPKYSCVGHLLPKSRELINYCSFDPVHLKDRNRPILIRKIKPQEHALPIEVIADIIENLVHQATQGRPNTRLGALQTLVLIWICIYSASYGHLCKINKLHGINKSKVCIEKAPLTLTIPTVSGDQEVEIPDTLASLLMVTSDSEVSSIDVRILSMPLDSLDAVLTRVVKRVNPRIGKITFLSFLSAPHFCGSIHRTIPTS